MLTKHISFLCIVFLFVMAAIFNSSCTEQKKNITNGNILPTSSEYSTDKLIDSLSKLFIDSAKCNDCIKELYIDKVYKYTTYLTFIARPYYKEYFIRNKPLFYFLINENKIFVYTGAEEFLKGNQEEARLLKFKDDKTEYWLRMGFSLTEDSVKLMKVAGSPFMPPMNQEIPVFDSSIKFNPSDYK